VLAWMQRVATVVAVVITVAVAGAVVAVVVGVHDGYQAVAMQTGSMAPQINPGDLAIIRRTDPRDLRAGDAITFQAPIAGTPVVTHRIVSVQSGAAGPSFHTKGDANQSADPWVVHYAWSGWRVSRVLPGVGAAFDFLGGGGGRLVIGLLVFLLVFSLVTAPTAVRAQRAAAALLPESAA